MRIVIPRAAVMAQQHPQLQHLLPLLPRTCLLAPQEALAVAAYRCALAGAHHYVCFLHAPAK